MKKKLFENLLESAKQARMYAAGLKAGLREAAKLCDKPPCLNDQALQCPCAQELKRAILARARIK